MKKKVIEKYADVLIKTGVNLYPGQCLNISCSVHAYDFALVLAEKAYKTGARFVNIDVSSNIHVRSRVENSDEKYLKYVPGYYSAADNEKIADGWAFLYIDNTEEQDVLSDTDASKIGELSKASKLSRKILRENQMKDKVVWCVAAYPGPVWAEKVTGSDIERLWEILVPILKLDSEDPSEEWKKTCSLLHRRAEILNEHRFDTLRFEGPGTDLKIGLSEFSRWFSATSSTPDGRVFLPNIPTEEIFTTPDFRRTEGRVKVTMPLKVMEKMVEGAWFEFKYGKVVNFGSDKGTDILEKYLQMDEGASFAGEIALVDSSSSIYKSGMLFGSILYDENASCHLALGAGYPLTFSNSKEFTSEDLQRQSGCNVSMVHTDFMIGSNEVSVTGMDKSGNRIEIIKSGKFVI
ncbi:MAG: aminopeptidase [Spirochaetes bacterium]|nr:aminopeptidase [Spirochaetota bacterium]